MSDEKLSAGAKSCIVALCIGATLITWALFAAYRDVDVWAGLQEANALKNPQPSDPVFRESIFRTRANTWSNLAYVYAGILAIVAGISDARQRRSGNYLLETPAMSIFFGLSCVYLGIGSGIFHASLTRWGQQLDVASMYSTLIALIALNLGRLYPHVGRGPGFPTWPFWLALAIFVDVLLYIYKWSMSSSVVLPGLILAVLIFGIADRFQHARRNSGRLLVASALSLLLAVACRALDVVGPLASPEVWLTGHALWHGFTAASLGFMYCYYRSESAL